MKQKLLLLCSVVVMVALYGVSAVAAGDEVLKVKALGKLQRPVSAFGHDMHSEKAADCSVCHHVYKDGKKVEGESSEDRACADCHTLKAKGNQPGLRMAYHQQCKNCHIEHKKGPVACGDCHKK